jgi:creatinine amidohydrolase/Fe(II)-dependent formamide hydrolase-like protein
VTTPAPAPGPLWLKLMGPGEVRRVLADTPYLIVPVGTMEHRGVHLPLGSDTLIVEHLADQLSTEFRVLRAPTIEYGVGQVHRTKWPGAAAVRRKTLHRFLNDLVSSWETSGVRHFVILTAHGDDPHQEALSTLHSRDATIRTVDIFAVPPVECQSGADMALPDAVAAILAYLEPARDHDDPSAPRRRDTGRRIYQHIYQRIADRLFRPLRQPAV